MSRRDWQQRMTAMIGLLLVVGLGGCDEYELPASRTVFWRLERDDTVIWLFGTAHVAHPRFTPLPGEVTTALRQTSLFLGETELTEDAQREMFKAMRLPDGQGLRELLGAERFAALLAAARQAGLPVSAGYLDGLRPWAAAMVLSQPRESSGPPLDLLLCEAARAQGCHLRGLETAAEQAAVFDDLDHELQLSLVDAAIVESTTGHRQYQRLIAAYLDQNLPALASEISETGLSEPDCHVFREALLTNRNARFCERILAALPEHQKIFVAVGAAHLLGPDGLLDLFRQQDFEIIPVPFQFAVPGQLRQLTLPLVPQNQ